MTDHRSIAENCLLIVGEDGPCGEDSLILMVEAKVHATLALADEVKALREALAPALRPAPRPAVGVSPNAGSAS